jgi:hypothetical protein
MTPTAPPGLPNALGDIISKVRRITKSPSPNQITDSQIIQYINTYFLYDFPQELRLKNCLSNYQFATIPFQETYNLPTDTIITIEPPVYINGYQSFFTQSQDQFYLLYPRLGLQFSGPSGSGITGPYTFTITGPGGTAFQGILQRNVVISVIDSATGIASAAGTDTPTNTVTGTFTGQGMSTTVTSSINYTTGVVIANFSAPIPSTSQIFVEYVPYTPSRPVAMLFYSDTIYLRPIPDAVYLVSVQAYINPIAAILGANYNPPIGQTYTPPVGSGTNDPVAPSPPNQYAVGANPNSIARGFVNSTDTPQIKQWWQLIAWGTSIKILEDRGDWENISLIQPRYDEQKRLVLRRTLVEMANERTATIYSEQVQYPVGNFFNQF